MPYSCSELHRRTVMDAAGAVLGDVDAVLFDGTAWMVSGLRVKVRRDMADTVGIGKGLWGRSSIDVPTRFVQSIGDAVLLRVKADELHDAVAEGGVEPAPPGV